MYKRKLLVCFLLLLFGSIFWPTILSPRSNSLADSLAQRHKVIAPPGILDPRTEGIDLWHDYEAFALYRLSETAWGSLPIEIREQLQLVDEMDEIQLGAMTFNPQEKLPDFLPSLRMDQMPAAGLQLIQFVGPIKDSWLAQVEATGSRPVHYVGSNSYLVWSEAAARERLADLVRQGDFLQYSGLYQPGLKLSAGLTARLNRIGQPDERVSVWVQLYDHGDTKAAEQLVKQLSVEQDSAWTPVMRYRNIAVTVHTVDLPRLAQLPDVVSISERFEPVRLDEGQTQILVGHLTGDGSQPAGPGYLNWLQGLGFSQNPADYPIVDIVDDGIGDGTLNSGDSTLHRFNQLGGASRLAYLANCTSANDSGSPEGHGHINVSIAGGYDIRSGYPYQDEIGFNRGLGVNPFGRFAGTKIFNGPFFDLSRCAGSERNLLQSIYQRGARIASNSWGCANCAANYDVIAQTFDAAVRDADLNQAGNQQLILLAAAGNSGPDSATINSPGTGKNVITVGASENYQPTWQDGCNMGPADADNAMDMANFSSRGPAPGNRAKPELVAPGTHIFGTASTHPHYAGQDVCDRFQPDDQTIFAASSGTSHSTPAVAGAASLIYWWLENIYDLTPSPALIKAYLIAHPTHLTGQQANDTLPSPNQGYGLPNLAAAFDDTPRYLLDQSVRFDQSGETWTFEGQVADPTKPVRIVLAYTDQPGMIGANPQVNDVSLSVKVNMTTYRGNQFAGPWSVAGGTRDQVNNYEAVFLPAGTSGDIKVTVTGFNIAGDGVPNVGDGTDQDFALVCYNCAKAPTFTLHVLPAEVRVCAPGEAVYNIELGQILGFSEPIVLGVDGLPAGVTAEFDPDAVTPSALSDLTIRDAGVAAGSYSLTIKGQANQHYDTDTVILTIDRDPPAPTVLMTPLSAALNQPIRPIFSWAPIPHAESYTIEIAADPGFTDIVDKAVGLIDPGYVPQQDLAFDKLYYWRVRAVNQCGAGQVSPTFTFITAPVPGQCPLSTTPQTVFQDNFEKNETSWLKNSSVESTWTITSQRQHSGNYAFFAPALSSKGDQQLTSPPIALPEGAYGLTLQFWNYQAIEDDVSSCWDGGLLELSTDGGQTWRSMSNQLLTDPYDGPVSTVWENPLGGQPAWCGDPQDWLNSIIDLSDFAGQTIRFRFRLGTDQSVSREGWYVDDVMIQACSSVLTLEETVGLEPAQCAADDQITVKSGAEVTYCYRLTNTGSITYTTHTLMTEQFGPLLNQFSYTLPPGASLVITRTATVTETAFNSTTWTAFDETMQTVSTASDAAGVIVKKGDYFLPLIRH